MKKFNLLAILSCVVLLLCFIVPVPENNLVLVALVGLIGGAIGIVLGVIGKNQIKKTAERGKGFALAGIIIWTSYVIAALLGTLLFTKAKTDVKFSDETLCSMDTFTKHCTDNGNGTSTCKYFEFLDIPCTTAKLKDTQFK